MGGTAVSVFGTGKVEILLLSPYTKTDITYNIDGCSVPRFRQRFAFLTPEPGNLYGMLDAAKVADVVVFLLSPEGGIDAYGEYCLTCLFGQGLPTAVVTVQVREHNCDLNTYTFFCWMGIIIICLV